MFLFGDVTVPVLKAAVAIERQKKRKTISQLLPTQSLIYSYKPTCNNGVARIQRLRHEHVGVYNVR